MSIVVAPIASVTALTIIKRALRLLGVYSAGEELSAEEAGDALSALNSMMDSLANDALQVYARSVDAIPLSVGQTSVTVGPSGAKLTDRPVKVLSETYLQIGNVSYPIDILTLESFNSIGIKPINGLTQAIYVQMGIPDATVYFWPQPSQACTLYLWSQKLIREFPALTTEVNLPPGYDRMLAFLLAEEIAPEYQVEPSPTVRQKAAASRRSIKRTNLEVPVLTMPNGIPGGVSYKDIRSF